MSIQPISSQNAEPCYLIPTLEKVPFELFEKICCDFEPVDLGNFYSSCETIWQINDNFKKDYPKIYGNLMTKVLSNSFGNKSIEQLSDEMIAFCTNTNSLQLQKLESNEELSTEEITIYQNGEFLKLKNLLDSLIICEKFSEVSQEKLERAFSSCCTYTHPNMVGLFIESGRYQDISIDCLNRAFGLDAPRDDGSTIQVLINSNRFKEISIQSLGDALKHAAINGHPGVVKAIVKCKRAHEITLKDFTKAFIDAAGNGESTWENGAKIKSLRVLMGFPQFNEVTREDLEQALKGSSSNWRGNAVQELIQSSRFHEISGAQLNKAFYWCMRNFTPMSVKAFIESNRFDEITIDCLDKSFHLVASRDDGTIMERLVGSKQFCQIGIESIGEALQEAARNEKPDALKAILGSSRFNEITLESFTKAVYRAAGLGFINTTVPIENLKMLINSPQFYKIHPNDLGKIFLNAVYSERRAEVNIDGADRKDAIQLLLQSDRFGEINESQLNQAVAQLLERDDIISLQAFIKSGKFHKINSELQVACSSKEELKELLTTSRST